MRRISYTLCRSLNFALPFLMQVAVGKTSTSTLDSSRGSPKGQMRQSRPVAGPKGRFGNCSRVTGAEQEQRPINTETSLGIIFGRGDSTLYRVLMVCKCIAEHSRNRHRISM